MSLNQDNQGQIVQAMPLCKTAVVGSVLNAKYVSIIEMESLAQITVTFMDSSVVTISAEELRHYSVPPNVESINIDSGVIRVS